MVRLAAFRSSGRRARVLILAGLHQRPVAKGKNSSSETCFLAAKTTGETPVPQFCHGLRGGEKRQGIGRRFSMTAEPCI
jgi:hypothetical protein